VIDDLPSTRRAVVHQNKRKAAGSPRAPSYSPPPIALDASPQGTQAINSSPSILIVKLYQDFLFCQPRYFNAIDLFPPIQPQIKTDSGVS